MPAQIAPEVQASLETLLKLEAEAPVVDSGIDCANLAEAIAVIVSLVRQAGDDEATWIEAVLRYVNPSRAKLIEAKALLQKLGYHQVSAVLSRLIRSAPRKPGYVKARELKKAARRRALLAAHRTRH